MELEHRRGDIYNMNMENVSPLCPSIYRKIIKCLVVMALKKARQASTMEIARALPSSSPKCPFPPWGQTPPHPCHCQFWSSALTTHRDTLWIHTPPLILQPHHATGHQRLSSGRLEQLPCLHHDSSNPFSVCNQCELSKPKSDHLAPYKGPFDVSPFFLNFLLWLEAVFIVVSAWEGLGICPSEEMQDNHRGQTLRISYRSAGVHALGPGPV